MPELEREFARESVPADFGEFRFVAFRDCGRQLHEALRLIQASSCGMLVYHRQEGCGIGLMNNALEAAKPGHYRD